MSFAAAEEGLFDDARQRLATAAVFKTETRGRKARDRVSFPSLSSRAPAFFDVVIRQTGSATSIFDGKRARMVLKTGLQRVLVNVSTASSLPDVLLEAVRRDLSKAHVFSVNAGVVALPVYIATEPEALSVMCGASFHTVAGILPPSSRKHGIVPPSSSDHSYFNNLAFAEVCVLAIFTSLVNRLTLTDRPILCMELACREAADEAEAFAAMVTDALLAIADKAKQRWSRGGGRVNDSESAEEYQAAAALEQTVKPKTKKRQRLGDLMESFAPNLAHPVDGYVGYSESVLPAADADQQDHQDQDQRDQRDHQQCLFDDADAVQPSQALEPIELESHESCDDHSQTTQKPQYTIADVESKLLISIYTLGWLAPDVSAQLTFWSVLYDRPAPILDHGPTFKDVVQSLLQFVRDIEMPYEVASHYVACWEHAGPKKQCL